MKNILNYSSFIKESLDFSKDERIQDAMDRAKEISKEEECVQHVEIDGNGARVSDWYDSDKTIASFENGELVHQRDPENYSRNYASIKYDELYEALEDSGYEIEDNTSRNDLTLSMLITKEDKMVVVFLPNAPFAFDDTDKEVFGTYLYRFTLESEDNEEVAEHLETMVSVIKEYLG